MRQKMAIRVTALVVVVLTGILVAFACGRQEGEPAGGEPQEQAAHGGEQEHGEAGVLQPSGTLQDGVRVVEVEARDWEFEPSTIVVRQGEQVRLLVTSREGTHGIAIEGIEDGRRLPEGETQEISFTAGEAGRRHFHCSVYCGRGHEDMHGELVVLGAGEEDAGAEGDHTGHTH